MLITAIAIKLTSRGPVFFKQVRVGQGGRFFWCYKFRSMCTDAESQKDQLMHLNEASGPVFKIKNDPRVTPIGGFIRKLSIDELPQFFNVLKGEMSLVGPRPPVPREVEEYTAFERGRLAVKPGITCLWQVSGAQQYLVRAIGCSWIWIISRQCRFPTMSAFSYPHRSCGSQRLRRTLKMQGVESRE